jgi:Raf kinase inhibitor-like YbhB/YbcL family protein
MKIHTNFEVIPDKYGKYAGDEDRIDGVPVVSFPFSIEDLPEGAVTWAAVFFDDDAIPVGGFSWIHWSVANVPASETVVPENFSQVTTYPQGKNSTAGKLAYRPNPLVNQKYNGPQPPNADHIYRLAVYALDTELPMKDGYWLNELFHAMEGHVLAVTHVDLVGKK